MNVPISPLRAIARSTTQVLALAAPMSFAPEQVGQPCAPFDGDNAAGAGFNVSG